MTSLTNNPKPKTKNFFSLQTTWLCWVFWRFGQLSSIFGARVMPANRLFPCKPLELTWQLTC